MSCDPPGCSRWSPLGSAGPPRTRPSCRVTYGGHPCSELPPSSLSRSPWRRVRQIDYLNIDWSHLRQERRAALFSENCDWCGARLPAMHHDDRLRFSIIRLAAWLINATYYDAISTIQFSRSPGFNQDRCGFPQSRIVRDIIPPSDIEKHWETMFKSWQK